MNSETNTDEKKSFIQKHGEIWKIIKWSITGFGASGIELIVYMILLRFVFVSQNEVPITNELLNFIGVKYVGYMYAYFLSATVGYSIAFIINRKYTFKADSNPAVSAVLNAIFVVFNIFTVTWVGSVISNFSVANDWGFLGDIIIKVIVMTVPSVWTYPVNRFIIHRVKKKPVAQPNS